MTAVIYKYEVPVNAQVHTIRLLDGDEPIVHVGAQNDDTTKVYFWAWSDTDIDHGLPTVERRFVVVGTGHPVTRGVKQHVGSVQVGPFVWHLLEVW